MPIPDHAIRTADVDGFRVVYAHQEEFDNLRREIFGDRAYRFDWRGAAPRILDCGAHIGLSVLYFKRRWPRAQITAFEPSPDTFALLERNVGSNGLADVELVNAAITASGDATSFYVPRDPLFWHWGDAATRAPWYDPEYYREITVRAVRLSAYLAGPVDFLKLDIEGLETAVLREADAAGRLAMIRRAVIEYHGSTKTPENSLPWLRDVLARRGFATAVRQGGRLTAEADLSRTGAWTALVHADRSRARLWWGFRREIAGRAAQKARRVAELNR